MDVVGALGIEPISVVADDITIRCLVPEAAGPSLLAALHDAFQLSSVTPPRTSLLASHTSQARRSA
jgi:hypothetical protein